MLYATFVHFVGEILVKMFASETMTNIELELRALSLAANTLVKSGRFPVLTFSQLPEWPSEHDFPVLLIPEFPIRLSIQPDPLLRAIGMRQTFDPDSKSPWVFVPAHGANAVWLVRTRALDASRN